MALNKNQLKQDLVEILKNPSITNNAEIVAQQLTDAIDKFVKTGNATGTDSSGDAHNLIIQ
ncbi:MAG TPA: hypothetical protein DDY16_01745 [Tenacibaculum sp.]|nr:hypothetical protein [Tenacibaculum sp.]